MPEFEETNSQPDPNHSYTPRTDASQKPRSRRRSGGFKPEVASSATANIGEVDASTALNSEQLGSHACPQDASNRSRPERKPAAANTDPIGKEAVDTAPEAGKISQKQGASRKPQAHRPPPAERITNPQPSAATLAAIKTVETRIAERRSERDARRKQRDKHHPATSHQQREARSNQPPSRKGADRSPPRKGLLAAINRFFAKLFAGEPASVDKRRPRHSGSRRQSVNHGDKHGRVGQTRPRGNRGGQNRRTGKRNRSSHHQHGEKRHSAQSH